MRRRAISGRRDTIARFATAGALASILALGSGQAASAAPDQEVNPSLGLMEAAADALANGDGDAYEALIDAAERDDVWLPAAAFEALFEREVQDLVWWSDVLDLNDFDLLDTAAYSTLEEERNALAVIDMLAPGSETTPDQTEDIVDADFDATGVLEVIDRRGIDIPDTVRSVLEPLSVTGEEIPTTDDYDAALDDLDALTGNDSAVTALPDAAPETAIANEAPAVPSTADATPTSDTETTPVVNDVTQASAPDTTSESSGSPLPMIAVAVLAAAALAMGSYALLGGRKRDQLADIAFTDGLTGLKNRRRLDADVAAQRERGERATATLMIDVDHFKSFNDTHGHAMGDEVLRLVGDALQQEFRRTDVPYRYGGEEFCVLLNDVTPGEAVSAGERARATISAVVLPIPERITVSIGVSVGSAEHLSDTIKRADAALYDAKAAGRDRVTFTTS